MRAEYHYESCDGYYGMSDVTVYKFSLALFGLQIDFIGLLQRIIDYCGPSIGCRQPLVFVLIPSLFAVI